MSEYNFGLLKLFGEGGEGGQSGEGADSSTQSADAGQKRLLELGVPADKLNRAVYRRGQTAKPVEAKSEGQVAAAESPTGAEPGNTVKEEAPKRMTWDEIKSDPEYNKEIQSIVQSRLRSAKAAEDNLTKLAPTLEVLSRKYGLDPANIDYDALSKAVNDDNDYYESKALELGVPVETAKKIDQQERETARNQRIEERTLEEQKIANHIRKLETEGEALKAIFPNFDLRKELANETFARLTAPGVNLSVEDAYRVIHRQEIESAASKVITQKTAEKLTNSIMANSARPAENGISSQGASVTSFDYRTASREQREALKRQIREAAANGTKIYPGQR